MSINKFITDMLNIDENLIESIDSVDKSDSLDLIVRRAFELSNVKYISIDLYDNYRDISSTYFPKAVICADSFHVLENLTRIFRTIRLRCRKNCKDENIQYLLSKFRFLFNHDQDLDNEAKYNKRFGRYMNYRQILNLIFERFPELKKAYDIKEEYIYFNSHCSSADAPKEINRMIQLFADSGIDEYVEFYNLLVNWRQEIINSFSIYHGKESTTAILNPGTGRLKSSCSMPMVLQISVEQGIVFFTVSIETVLIKFSNTID